MLLKSKDLQRWCQLFTRNNDLWNNKINGGNETRKRRERAAYHQKQLRGLRTLQSLANLFMFNAYENNFAKKQKACIVIM